MIVSRMILTKSGYNNPDIKAQIFSHPSIFRLNTENQI